MSITLIVLIVEAVLVLLGIVGFLLYLRWKRQKTKATEFESLLTKFSGQADSRKAQLIHLLTENYEVEINKAEESANYMMEAEKQFLQQFLIQQIEQKPVNDFYQNLCELLDQYIYFIPSLKTENNMMNIGQPQVHEDVLTDAIEKDGDSAEAIENSTDELNPAELNKVDSVNTTESDKTKINGDVLDQDNDISTKSEADNAAVPKDSDPKLAKSTDSVVSETLAEKTIIESNESGDEPDWGDAFAESGDEVDETTEAAYEAEKNKS